MGELPKRAAFHRVDFGVLCIGARKRYRAARGGIPARKHDRRREQLLYFAARDADLSGIDRAIVRHQESYPLAVCAEGRRRNAAVKSFGRLDNRWRASSVGRNQRKVTHAVCAELLLFTFEIGDPLSIRAEFESRTPASARSRGGAFFCGHLLRRGG